MVGDQRADPGAGRLLLVRRLEGVAVRRHPHVRPGGHQLLHPRQGRHLALARPGHLDGRPRLPASDPHNGRADDRHDGPLPTSRPTPRHRCARDDRAHVFHSWSAQALIDPLPIADGAGLATSGTTTASATSTSPASWSTSTSATSTRSWSPRSRSRPAGCARSRRPSPTTPAREAARLIAELAPGDLNKVFFTNGGAEANENAVRMARLHTGRHKVLATYRSYHGATAGAIAADRRPAALGHRAGACRASCTSGVRTPTARRSTPTTDAGGVRARAAAPARHDHGRGRRSTIAAIILETVVGTNGILVPPPGYLAGVREHLRRARHRADRRRGDGRLRPLRRVVRRRPLGRRARPDHLRQGRELRLRAARRRHHLRRDRRRRSTARLPRRPHLLRPPARLRRRRSPRSRSSRRRASSSTPATLGEDVIGPGAARARRAAPVASARCAGSACSGRSSWSRPARPASRWCRSTPPARPPRRWTSSPRPASSAGSGRSSTSTASTSCRRARSPADEVARGPGDPRRGARPSPTATTPAPTPDAGGPAGGSPRARRCRARRCSGWTSPTGPAPGPAWRACDRPTSWSSAAATPGCGPRCWPRRRDPGARVVLLEAGRIGWAASGRNGGFCAASLTHGEDNGLARWPAGVSTRCERLGPREPRRDRGDGRSGTASTRVRAHRRARPWPSSRTRSSGCASCAEHGADAVPRRGGRAGPGRLAHLPRRGLRTATSSALVHPAKLAWGLAARCRALGVRIFEDTRGHRASQPPAPASRAHGRAATSRGRARSRWPPTSSRRLLRRNRLHTVPVYDYALMTEPLTDDAARRPSAGRTGRGSATPPTSSTTTG